MPLPQTNINAFTGMNAPTRSDPDNFDGRAEDAWNRLKSSQAQFNTLAGQVNDMATAANASATNAATSAALADQDRIDAQQARTDAQTARTQAQGYRNEAEGFKNTALTAVDSLTATSTTSNVIGAGSKTWTGTGLAAKSFKVGQRLRAVNPANVAQWMEGQVTAYTNNGASSSITIGVSGVDLNSATSGNTVANWSFTIAGERGQTGPTGGLSGGNATGAINEKRHDIVPVSAAPDIWNVTGNLVAMSGSGTITGFPQAPQAGATRTLLMSQPNMSVTIVEGGGLLVFGGTQTVKTEDEVDVTAIGTNYFRVSVRKRDGTPVAHDRGALHNLRVFGASGVFTPTKTGFHKFTAVGPSGSGGVASADTGGQAAASGAGAGGFITGMRYLTAGVPVVVNVGAPGSAVSIAGGSANTAIDGNDGGITTISGSGITTMTANGGNRGRATITIGSALTGGEGGSATGAPGDMAVTGGAGGDVGALVAGAVAASGGGAIGIRGGTFKGGNATASASGAQAAGGGAGVGGKGGNATRTTAGSAAAAGGGCAGAASDVTDATAVASQAGANHRGVNGGAGNPLQNNELDSATSGGNAPGDGASGVGGGSAGATGNAVANPTGGFAGVGGRVVAGNSNITASSSLYGGAPGGAAAVTVGSAGGPRSVSGAPGAAGVVWIEF